MRLSVRLIIMTALISAMIASSNPLVPHWLESYVDFILLLLILFGAVSGFLRHEAGYRVYLLAFMGLLLWLYSGFLTSGGWIRGFPLFIMVIPLVYVAVKFDWDFRRTVMKLATRVALLKFLGVILLYLALLFLICESLRTQRLVWEVPLALAIAGVISMSIGAASGLGRIRGESEETPR